MMGNEGCGVSKGTVGQDERGLLGCPVPASFFTIQNTCLMSRPERADARHSPPICCCTCQVETAGDTYIVSCGILDTSRGDGLLHVPEGPIDPLECARKVMAFAVDMLVAARTVTMPHNGEPITIRIGELLTQRPGARDL